MRRLRLQGYLTLQHREFNVEPWKTIALTLTQSLSLGPERPWPLHRQNSQLRGIHTTPQCLDVKGFTDMVTAGTPAKLDKDLMRDRINDDGRPRAAVTFGTFPNHVTKFLSEEGPRRGFQSRYWITATQVKKRGVELKPGAVGVQIPDTAQGIEEFSVVNVDVIDPEQLKYFYEDHPLPKDAYTQGGKCYAFCKERWRLVTDPKACAEMQAQKQALGYGYNWWMDLGEASSLNFRILPPRPGEPAPVPITVTEGTILTIYNIEQAMHPKLLIPTQSAIHNVLMNE